MEICIKHKKVFLIELDDEELKKDRNINLMLDFKKYAFSVSDTKNELYKKNHAFSGASIKALYSIHG